MVMDMRVIMSRLAALGRDKEREVIEEKLDGLARGRGGTIMVKSEREAGENLFLRSILIEKGIPALHGVCQPYPYLEPYDVFSQNFPQFFSRFRLQNLHSFSEALAEFDGGLYRGPWARLSRRLTRKKGKELEVSYSSHVLHMEFSRLLQQKLPIVFLLEDIHWADLATFRLLTFLLRAFRERPALFIVTANPEILDSPALPYELRDVEMPVIQKLQAMQLVGGLPLSSKGRREFLQEIESFCGGALEIKPLDNKMMAGIVQKIVGTALPEFLLDRVVNLSQGNIFFLEQILLYLLDKALAIRGSRWQLQLEPHQVEVPGHIEAVLQANLEKLDPTAFSALKYAAVFGNLVPLELWKKVVKKDIGTTLDTCYRLGILQPSLTGSRSSASEITDTRGSFTTGDAAIFSSYKHREAILQKLSPEERKATHYEWAELLQAQDISVIRAAYHKRYGDPTASTTREALLNAGLGAERMLAYEEAYQFYRDIAELFPQQQKFGESLHQLAEQLSGKERQTAIINFMAEFRFYRVAALSAAEPLLLEKEKKLLQKIIYQDTPHRFYPVLGPLVLYLLKVVQREKRAYPQDDLMFLLNLVAGEVLSPRDYQRAIALWGEIALHKPIAPKNRMPAAKYWEKWGSTQNLEDRCASYLTSAFLAQRCDDHFEAARVLHKIVRLALKSEEEFPPLFHYEVEALRLLGNVYEKWAAKAKEDDEKLRHAIQSTSAYRDAVNRLLEAGEASWLAERIMERCFNLCETYYLENELIVAALKSARVKRELKAEEEYTGKALIAIDEDDMGCAGLLEQQLFEERLWPEIVLTPPPDFAGRQEAPGYRCSFVVFSPYSRCWKNAVADLRPCFAFSGEGQSRVGWVARETPGHVCFIIAAEHPGALFQTVLKFCSEKILKRYV